MVNNLGVWTFEPDTPEDKKCNMDLIAEYIIGKGYVPKTTLENLCCKILLHYETDLESEGFGYFCVGENPNGNMIDIEDVDCYVEASGGIAEFDYEA